MAATRRCPDCGREMVGNAIGSHRRTHSGNLHAFFSHTPDYLIEAMRACFPGPGRQPDLTPLQKAYIARWVEVKVMGGTWQSADKVIAEARAEEIDQLTPKLGGFPCPDCGRRFESAQALGPHRRHAHGHEAGPPPEKPPKPKGRTEATKRQEERMSKENRPRQVLLRACSEDLQALVDGLREIGWPAEIIAVNEDGFFGLRVEIRLDALAVPG